MLIGDVSLTSYSSVCNHSTSLSPEEPIRRVFAVHGGISCHMQTLRDLEMQNRIFNDFGNSKEQQLIQDLLWADPNPQIDGYSESPRGCG